MTERFILKGKVSLRFACEEAKHYLSLCGIEDAAVDAWYLMELVTGVTRAQYLADPEKNMDEEPQDAYSSLVNQRGAHIPLQHLTGEQEFMGLPFLVNEHVLIPRQDTETLVELALTILEKDLPGPCAEAGRDAVSDSGIDPGNGSACTSGIDPGKASARGSGIETGAEPIFYRVLDLCTGSGCIAVSMVKQWESRQSRIRQRGTEPGAGRMLFWQDGRASNENNGDVRARGVSENNVSRQLEMYASDLSEEALTVARENARRLGAEVHFIQSDLFAQVFAAVREFDMIVSNPPYIRTSVIEELSEEVRLHEPRMALNGGVDGLDFYRRIISESCGCLRPGGRLLMETGYDQGEAVSAMMRENGFSAVSVTKDLTGNDRVVSGRWIAATSGEKA